MEKYPTEWRKNRQSSRKVMNLLSCKVDAIMFQY